MKATTTPKPDYTFVRIANGRFVTGSQSKGNKEDLGNCLEDFITTRISVRLDTYDSKEITELRLYEADGKHVLCLAGIHAMKALQRIDKDKPATFQTWEEPQKENPARMRSQLSVKGTTDRGRFELLHGDDGVLWDATMRQYIAQHQLMQQTAGIEQAAAVVEASQQMGEQEELEWVDDAPLTPAQVEDQKQFFGEDADDDGLLS